MPGGIPTEGWLAIVAALAALGAASWFLFRRPRRRAATPEPIVVRTPPPPSPVAPPAPPLAPQPAPPPEPATSFLTVPLRPRSPAAASGEPQVEIVLQPKRAGTNVTSAAVDYRVLVRNAGGVPVRDVRFAMFMLSASARQTQDLQSIFATPIDQPAAAPFDLQPNSEIELTGMALLAREQVNVMTIEGQPWFVPVLAMKAEYRWGENVGAPGSVNAAYMIGIDRGEGAKMAPFRLDGGPQMHPRVAARKVV
ncbi:MAG: hypothetical protein J0I47_08815 [Sphingomonas sp.]|uniref:hypothetical protein n=1 Tax=Sphingomonas sp. TaxID=28214 RepID=UPI001AC9B157|nr:hypothetical protein [Sphingomonas sp.]MBN8808321.1 hypothetical protein [Sphingomonas sp.]